MASLLRRVLGRRDERGRRTLARSRRRRKRRCSGGKVDHKIVRFREWCREAGIELHPHLRIGRAGSCSDVGVVATADIPRGTVLARIPRSVLLTSATSRAGPALRTDREFHRQRRTINSWVPLLIALLAEYSQKESSFWEPYLSLVPSPSAPGPALQWPPGERERLLRGTGVEERVERDQSNIDKDYNEIVLPFMRRHPEIFKDSCSKRFYEQLVCLVMAYSFTDDGCRDVCGQTMMVPYVDLLNHHSLHHTQLTFHPHHLLLKTVRNIQQGSEVMNTYGPLSNASLLHVYGFSEEGNPHNVALIQSSTIKDAFCDSTAGSHDLSCDKRWQRLQGEEVMDEEFEVDCSGHPEPSLLAVVKLLLVSESEYEDIRETVMTEEEMCVESLSQVEKEFLLRLCRISLAKLPLPTTDKTNGLAMTSQETFAMRLCLGQRQCLARLVERL